MPSISSLAVDVDNVLADSISRWCVLAKNLGYSVAKDQIMSHKLVGSVPIEPDQIFRIQDAVWMDWRNLSPTEPSLHITMAELKRRLVKIVVVTSGPSRHRSGIESWLRARNLPFDEFYSLGPRVSKTTVMTDALVDDAPEAVSSFISTGRQGFLYSQPWNKNAKIRNAIVIRTLRDILQYIS
jgi:5'(3')-deoxyribonucleotidase